MKRGLFILVVISISLINLTVAEDIIFEYPDKVIVGLPFYVNLTIINFSQGIYDVKVDVYNLTTDSNGRLSQIYDSGIWKSTFNYVNALIDTSINNNSVLLLNITKDFNESANITVTLRKSTGSTKSFNGYLINISSPLKNISDTNNNSSNSTCTQNWSCTDWSSCSGSSKTRTCQDTNNCNNSTGKPAESQTCTMAAAEPSIELEWNSEDIINDQEFDITVKAYNLQGKDYDVRVWLEFENNETTISERYGRYNDEEVWRSGKYYAEKFFSGTGNKSEDIKIRIIENYDKFKGNAVIKARIRETTSENLKYETSRSINILNDTHINNTIRLTSSQNQTAVVRTAANSSSLNLYSDQDVIVLGKSNTKPASNAAVQNSIIYKSKNESIKEYMPYAFSILCIFLMVLFAIDRKKINKKE